jgi:DNA-binding response OmpR family regulator/signal transduction histidine kinase
VPENREKILVVARDPSIVDFISRQALAAVGYRTLTANDFSSAMDAVISFRPDTMILDVQLEGMNATDLMMALSTQGISVPVIALGPKGEEARVIQAFRVGAVDYVLWPAREPEIISVVERSLAQLRMKREKEQLASELQQRVQDLTAISHLGKTVTSTTNMQDLYNKLLQAALNSTKSETGWLSILEEDSKDYSLVSCHNLPQSILGKVGKSWNDGISQQVLKNGKIFQLSGEKLQNHPVAAFGQAIIILPIVARQQVIGMLTLMRRESKPYSESDIRILEALGDYAAISLANAYLFTANEEGANSLHYSLENFQLNQKVSYSLVKAIKHEIQTSLKKISAVYAQITMSKTSPLQEKQKDRMVQLNSAISELASLADAISLPLLERPSFSPSSILLNELIRSEVGQLKSAYKKLNITPRIDEGDNQYINCQPSIMGAIIRGMLCLGLKYSNSGEELHIQLDSVSNGGIQVKVGSLGESILQEQVDRLFMADNSVIIPAERRHLGIGLDPSLIRDLVKSVGGEFAIEPLEMGGIRFRVIFPTS